MKSFALIAALILLQIAAACAQAGSTAALDSVAKPAGDVLIWLDAMRAHGARVELMGEVEQPFLSVTGSMVQVNGEDVQVFAYPGAADVETQAARISPDGGTVGTSKIHWIGTPHFFKQGKLLVLYVGENSGVLRILEGILGRQFAGK